MKKLTQKEWIAVVVSVAIVGFFFIFGQNIISIFAESKASAIEAKKPKLVSQDLVVGMGQEAETGDRIVVHYTGRFVDGTIFDSSESRSEPYQFVLGSGQVIKGWDQGIVGMRVGGKRTLSIPPELGFGMNDYGPIPGGSTLIYEIELLRVD